MQRQPGFYKDQEGNIGYQPIDASDVVQESAGNFYYFKTPEGQTQIVLFSGINDKTKAVEFEFATFVRADYGLCNPKATGEEKSANADKFLAKVAQEGPESSEKAALRSAVKETNGAISTEPVNKARCDIISTPHKCWCAPTEAETKITIIPFELTSGQLKKLKATNFTQFPGGIVLGTLTLEEDGKPKLMVDGVDFLQEMAKLRGFNKILLKNYQDAIYRMLEDIVKAKSVHLQKGVAHSNFYAAPLAAKSDSSPELPRRMSLSSSGE